MLASVLNPLQFIDHNTLQGNLFRRQLHPITGVYNSPSNGTMAAAHLYQPQFPSTYISDRLPDSHDRYTKNLQTYSFPEPRIKRIRFKPGYSRI